VNIKLKKLEEGTEWSAIDDHEEVRKARHKALADKGASTMELLNNMYKDADEETQRSLRESYLKGQEKREMEAKAKANV